MTTRDGEAADATAWARLATTWASEGAWGGATRDTRMCSTLTTAEAPLLPVPVAVLFSSGNRAGAGGVSLDRALAKPAVLARDEGSS